MTSSRIIALAVMVGILLTACGGTPLETDTNAQQPPESEFDQPGNHESELSQTEANGLEEMDQDGVSVSTEDEPTLRWPDGQVQVDEQGNVEISIAPLNLRNPGGTLNFSVGLDTHSVDLDMDLASMATLETDIGLGVKALLWDAPRGGHHVSGILSFPTITEGALLLEGASNLTLTIRDVDAPTRIFTWFLKD